jgi:hypothetical protein
MKWGLEIRKRHSFETHLSRHKDLTGNLESISSMTSQGRAAAMAVSLWFACLDAIPFVIVAEFLTQRGWFICLVSYITQLYAALYTSILVFG